MHNNFSIGVCQNTKLLLFLFYILIFRGFGHFTARFYLYRTTKYLFDFIDISMVYLKLNFQFCDISKDRPNDKATEEVYVGSPFFNALSAHNLLRNAVSSKTPSVPSSEQPGNTCLKTIFCRRNGVSPHYASQSDGPPFFCL